MFTRGTLRRVIPSALEIFKATSARNLNMPVRCFSSLDIPKTTYVPNSVLYRTYAQEAKAEVMTADYYHVKKSTSDSNILLVDVREPDEIKEHGKIPNSINIPLGNVTSALGTMSEKEFQEAYNKAKPNKNTEIIFYCMIGKRSGKAQQNAIDLGYKNTKNYVGSWTDWSNKEKQ